MLVIRRFNLVITRSTIKKGRKGCGVNELGVGCWVFDLKGCVSSEAFDELHWVLHVRHIRFERGRGNDRLHLRVVCIRSLLDWIGD